MCAFLAHRYPEAFTIKRGRYEARDSTTHGESIGGKEAGAIIEIENRLTGDSFNFEELRKSEGPAWNPMKYAGRALILVSLTEEWTDGLYCCAVLQQDDLAVMVEDENGEYRFQAGSICTAGFWRLEDKIGRSLHEIHTNGKVPQFREKLKFSMER